MEIKIANQLSIGYSIYIALSYSILFRKLYDVILGGSTLGHLYNRKLTLVDTF